MSVVTLDAVRPHLNITGFDYDAELQPTIDAAEAVLAQHVGPLASAVVTTSRVKGGREYLVLPVSPVVSLTSVTPVGGTALNLADLTLDGAAGMVTNALGGRFGYTTYDVVYTAGRATLPADLTLAVKELTRHLWESQRNPAPRPGFTDDLISSPAAGYLLPYRVQELIAPHMQFGVA